MYKSELKTKSIAVAGFNQIHDIISCRNKNLLSFPQFGNHQECFEFYFDRMKHCSYNSLKVQLTEQVVDIVQNRKYLCI